MGPDGRKVRALTDDPMVGIEADREEGVIPASSACAFGIRYRSAIGSGSIVFLSDPAEKMRALTLITHRYGGERIPFDTAESLSTLVIWIDPDTLVMKQPPKKETLGPAFLQRHNSPGGRMINYKRSSFSLIFSNR